MSERTKLKEALTQYVKDTLSYIVSVKGFLLKECDWVKARNEELEKLVKINNYARKKRKNELATSLKATLIGLEQLKPFLDAVEKLAVTSVHVFQEHNQMLHLTKESSVENSTDIKVFIPLDLGTVQVIISAAQIICPQLVKFKRDNKVFFSPKLQNVEVLANQLDQYIKAVQKICGVLKASPFSDFCDPKCVVDINEDVSEHYIPNMLSLIKKLDELRINENLRMVFIFQEKSCGSFIAKFSECQRRMQQFLNELEDSAVQLDQMNMGSKISSVAGSSVGAIGGLLFILSLALTSATSRVSLVLTIAGLGMGLLSGACSLVTAATEIGVNYTQKKKVNKIVQEFMDDVKILQECLNELTYLNSNQRDLFSSGNELSSDALAMVKSSINYANTICSSIETCAEQVAEESKDIGQVAAKGALALSKGLRFGFIAVHVLFLGMDLFFIVKDSKGLFKGSKTKMSKFIRARAALWCSEIDAWQKIHDSLNNGQSLLKSCYETLKTKFYPDVKLRKEKVQYSKVYSMSI